MVRVCCAWYCANQDTKEFRDPPLNLLFFRFPSNELLREKWRIAVTSGRRDNFMPYTKTSLCSIHFEDTDFCEDPTRSRLKPDAVPTLFYIPNAKEEREMIEASIQNPNHKPRMGTINGRRPRRLRKIYVDEKSHIDEQGRLRKSFSYFVLPLAFSKGIRLKPVVDPRPQIKPPTAANRIVAVRSGGTPTSPVVQVMKGVQDGGVQQVSAKEEGKIPSASASEGFVTLRFSDAECDEAPTSPRQELDESMDASSVLESQVKLEPVDLATDATDHAEPSISSDRPSAETSQAIESESQVKAQSCTDASQTIESEPRKAVPVSESAKSPETDHPIEAEPQKGSENEEPDNTDDHDYTQNIPLDVILETEGGASDTDDADDPGEVIIEETVLQDSITNPSLNLEITSVTSLIGSRKEKVDSYWKRLCSASYKELSYAREYEDDDLFPSQTYSSKMPSSAPGYVTGKQRRKNKFDQKYIKAFGITESYVPLERIDEMIRRPAASFFKRNLQGPRDKGLPRRTFYYQKPPEFDSGDIPMKPISVALEMPGEPLKSSQLDEPSYIKAARARLKSSGVLAQRRFVDHQKREVMKEKIKSNIKEEHSYFNHDTYYDDQGRLVLNDPRVPQLRETIAKLKKQLRMSQQQLRRKDAACQKKIDRAKKDVDSARRDFAFMFDNCGLHPVTKDLFVCELKNLALSENSVCRYSETVKDFCKLMYSISPKAYQLLCGYFHLPSRQRIRNYKANSFILPAELPQSLASKAKGPARNVKVELPEETVAVDLENHDKLYDLTTQSAENIPDEQEFSEDEYESISLENPPPCEEELDLTARAGFAAQGADKIIVGVDSIKRRSVARRPAVKRKLADSHEEVLTQEITEVSLTPQQWIREPQEFERKVIVPQYTQAVTPVSGTSQVFNLYTHSQPGPSRIVQQQVGQPTQTVTEVYLGSESLKTFDAYYF